MKKNKLSSLILVLSTFLNLIYCVYFHFHIASAVSISSYRVSLSFLWKAASLRLLINVRETRLPDITNLVELAICNDIVKMFPHIHRDGREGLLLIKKYFPTLSYIDARERD